jgi:Ca-activated chloride channel family protein
MSQNQNTRVYLLVAVLLGLLLVAGLCCVGWALVREFLPAEAGTPTPEATPVPNLTIGYSPEKGALFVKLVEAFNAEVAASSVEMLPITAVEYEPDLMIEAALDGQLDALSPDTSIWLDSLDREWKERTGREAPLTGRRDRYAISPVVIAMWEDVARSMGYPDKALGWSDLLERARSDPEFKWSHPSTSSAAGLLATMAMFYAGADKTRDLTVDEIQAQPTIDYVAAVQKTVRYYGESEWAVIQRLQREGRAFLDAFVCQEQLVVYYNTTTRGPDRLVAIYPVEGALWEDHPLSLLETDDLTDQQRATYQRFVAYLRERETQAAVLSGGYRPTDLSIPLDVPESPLTLENGADVSQPKTVLQMPSPGVIDAVRDTWWITKRHTNVYLVVDVSGSMSDDNKLGNAQQALRVFMEQIVGDIERVGLIEFSTQARETVPLQELSQNRNTINRTIDRLEAQGDTSLLDAVDLGYQQLQRLNDAERINALVVMTDGRENRSGIRLDTLVERIKSGNQSGVPVIILTIGYGSDADEGTLRALAEASGGQYYAGDLETIRRLYKILSTYF